MITILFTSVGARLDLMNCFREDAAELKLPLSVLAADPTPDYSVGCLSADRSFRIRSGSPTTFIAELLGICNEFNVDLIVPCHGSELAVLSQAKPKFAAIGTRIHVSKPEVIRLALEKEALARWLEAHDIPMADSDSLDQTSGHASLARREFQVHLFFDQSGRFRCAVPLAVGDGRRVVTRRHPAVMELAGKVGTTLKGAVGSICFDAILTGDGEPVVSKINPLFGDAYPLAHRAGAKFSKWLLEELSGKECSASNVWVDNLMMLRHDAAVFSPAPDDQREATLFWLNPGPPV